MEPFICLEGVDAVGKTEVAKCLAAKLRYSYYKSPGEPFASVRKMVDESVDPLTRYFFYRSATQNDSRSIAGLLATSGVVCDRYIYSVENDLLHRVDIPDNLTVATLVITHENVGWVTNDLLSEKSIGFNRTTLPSPAMTKQEIIEKVEALRNHMGI